MKIRIIIEGETQSGKSAIAMLLKQTLAVFNIEAVIHDQEELPGVIESTAAARLERVARRGTKVEIYQRPLRD